MRGSGASVPAQWGVAESFLSVGVDVPCFKRVILMRDFKGQEWKLGHQKEVFLEGPVRGDGGVDCSGGGGGVEQEITDVF